MFSLILGSQNQVIKVVLPAQLSAVVAVQVPGMKETLPGSQ